MLRGGDFAKYQGAIDYDALVANDCHYGWMKATEGEAYADPFFVRNWHAASLHPVFLAGAYAYLRPDLGGPRAQALNFARTIGRLDEDDLPPAADLEHAVPGMPPRVMIEWTEEYCWHVDGLTGKQCGVYVGKFFWQEHCGELDSPVLAKRWLWLPWYGVQNPPDVPRPWRQRPRPAWDFHQYDGDGGQRMPNGVDADFNRAARITTRAELLAWTRSLTLPTHEAPPPSRPSPPIPRDWRHDPGTLPGDWRPATARTVLESLGLAPAITKESDQ